MEPWHFAILIKAFIIFAFIMFVWGCHYVVWRFLPDGKIKDTLLRPRAEKIGPDYRARLDAAVLRPRRK